MCCLLFHHNYDNDVCIHSAAVNYDDDNCSQSDTGNDDGIDNYNGTDNEHYYDDNTAKDDDNVGTPAGT